MNHLLHWQPAFRASQARRILILALGAICLLGGLALAGCGVTTTTGVGGGGGLANSSTPNPGGPRVPGQDTPVGGAINGTTVRPCTGASVAPAKTPNIVLTVKNSHQTTKAHVGDVIEIALPSGMNWNAPGMGPNSPNSTLTPLQPQGGMDEQSQTCRWVYEAHAKGTVTLAYTGVLRCESGMGCPAIAEDEAFTIQVG